MTTTLTCPGHQHLPDGKLLRLDAECGAYVASQYWPDHTERRHYRGTLTKVIAVLAIWAAEVDA